MPETESDGVLSDDRLISRLRELVVNNQLDPQDFVIFGSGPLLAHGIRKVRDLDVVARGRTWEWACRHGKPGSGDVNGAYTAEFYDGAIQFTRGWISEEYDADALIERAERFGGLLFAHLDDVLRYKTKLGRPKDHSDIEALNRLLKKRRSTVGA
jgi:hypothetical protein